MPMMCGIPFLWDVLKVPIPGFDCGIYDDHVFQMGSIAILMER